MIVAAVDIYMDVIDRVLGEDATDWLKEWIMYKSGTADVNITLDECQLDALRGDKAACGMCNSTLAGVVPVRCASRIGSLDILWHNTDRKSRSFSSFCHHLIKTTLMISDISHLNNSGREKIQRSCMLCK